MFITRGERHFAMRWLALVLQFDLNKNLQQRLFVPLAHQSAVDHMSQETCYSIDDSCEDIDNDTKQIHQRYSFLITMSMQHLQSHFWILHRFLKLNTWYRWCHWLKLLSTHHIFRPIWSPLYHPSIWKGYDGHNYSRQFQFAWSTRAVYSSPRINSTWNYNRRGANIDGKRQRTTKDIISTIIGRLSHLL